MSAKDLLRFGTPLRSSSLGVVAAASTNLRSKLPPKCRLIGAQCSISSFDAGHHHHHHHHRCATQPRFQYGTIARDTTSFLTRARYFSSTSSSSPSSSSSSSDNNDNNNDDNNDDKNDSTESKKAAPKVTADHPYDYEGIDTKTRKEMQKRHQGIEMNSDGLSQFILPGEYVVKTNQKTGSKKMVSIERSLGYFWYMKDLRDSNDKPIRSNSKLIPPSIAQVFPPLGDVGEPLTTLTDQRITLPQHITRNNRSMDESSQCTLIAVHFNAFGYQMLPTWTQPFNDAFGPNDSNRVETLHLSIQEGYTLRLLRYIINHGYRKNVADGEKGRMGMYFGYCPELRDVLRMHNDKTGYVFLLDGIGRVRFAGSGRATREDVDLMLRHANELAPGLKGVDKGERNGRGSSGRRGRRAR